jgi:hypothetical protein
VDYLVPGRAIVLTFHTTRTAADARAQADLSQALREIGKQYKGVMSELGDLFPEQRR